MLLKCHHLAEEKLVAPNCELRGGLAVHRGGETDLSTLPFGALGRAVINEFTCKWHLC